MTSPVDFFHEHVRPLLTIEAVYGASVHFTRTSGRWWRGPCPLHDGRDPNFSVDTVTLRFHCHSRCGGGDVLEFANGGRTARGAEFIDGVRKLAALVGLEGKARWDGHTDAPQIADDPSELLEAVLAMSRAELASARGKRARDHLGRTLPTGIDSRDLDLGVFPDPEDVALRLAESGFDAGVIARSGVLADRRWGGRLIGAWRGRRGRVRTLFARDLSGTTAPETKYLALKGTRKAELVAFGLDVALAAAREAGGRLALVEGYLDAIVPQAVGLTNVAAAAGSLGELSAARLASLAAMRVRSGVLVPDFDPKPDACARHDERWCESCAPGAAGASKAVHAFATTHETPELFVVPPRRLYEAAGSPTRDGGPVKVDPASLVGASGVDAMRELVAQPVHAFRFLADHMAAMARGGGR